MRRRHESAFDLDRAVLLTVLYADLFDYALSLDELFHRLVGRRSASAEVEEAVVRLVRRYLSVVDEFVVWTGREHLVELRRRRREAAPELWRVADRYSRWLARIPFVRMVAVSGSLAVENAERGSDVDLFCITQADRLWIARLFIVPLSRLTRRLPDRFPLYLCPNYIVATNALEVHDRNLFTAHEIAQATPIWGPEVFQRFLDANEWVEGFLPHLANLSSGSVSSRVGSAGAPGSGPSGSPTARIFARVVEHVLRGRVGDAVDRCIYRAFLSFYRRRAERSGWTWEDIEPAYQQNRYTVPEGGYAGVVRRLFAERVGERLGHVVTQAEIEALFPGVHPCPGTSYDWERQFRGDYGGPSRIHTAQPVQLA